MKIKNRLIPHYFAIHKWVRANKPKPILCENCNKERKLEIANKSGKYKRDIRDYKWICKSCHRKFDRNNNCYAWTQNRIGKTNVQLFGKEKAKEISKKISQKKKGKKHSEETKIKMRGIKKPYLSERNRNNKGKSYEEIFGKQKAREMKIKLKKHNEKRRRNKKGQFKN